MKKFLILASLCFLFTSCSKLNIFGFGEKKNKYEKLKINQSLWIATNNVLNSYPNTQSDLKEGNVKTDWIILKNNPNVRFRISVYILGSSLSKENMEIFTEKEINKNGSWQRGKISDVFNKNLKKKII